MFRKIKSGFSNSFLKSVLSPESSDSARYYKILRINMIIIMLLVTIIPLSIMYIISYHEYQEAIREQAVHPQQVLLNKTKHSFELFLTERLSAVSFIASAYLFDELADQQSLNRIFQVMKQTFGGFVDLGLIDSNGLQVSYVGPFSLAGKSYKDQDWFHEVSIKGTYISDVFTGYRKHPHFVIAAQQMTPTGETWVVRATIDTDKFNSLIWSMGLKPGSDAFVLNREGVLQTPSKFYGDVFERFPFGISPVSYEPNIIETMDQNNNKILLGYAHFKTMPFVLVLIKPSASVMRLWGTLKTELLFIFVVSIIVIILVVFKITGGLVKQIEELEIKKSQAFREIEHTNKLASIGRLAAGVAHEINNPMAIIDQKAGLLTDLIDRMKDFPQQEKFAALAGSILKSVDRCRAITHRLLGFARRMDVKFSLLDLNDVIEEVLSLLEQEASHRNIEIQLNLAENLPKIFSDQGQLQQVLLNILNNGLSAVDKEGKITIASWEYDVKRVAISIQDNGSGMSRETMKHIFEPFFTTKRDYGTGLGLSITYGIVKKLGGDIRVESQEGKGTKFTVILAKQVIEGGEL